MPRLFDTEFGGQHDPGCCELTGLYSLVDRLKLHLARAPDLYGLTLSWYLPWILPSIFLCLTWYWHVPTIDGEGLANWLCIVWFAGLTGLIFLVLTIVSTWKDFERVLRRLARHPLQHAFDHLPDKASKEIKKQLLTAMPHEMEAVELFERLKSILRLDKSLVDPNTIRRGTAQRNRLLRSWANDARQQALEATAICKLPEKINWSRTFDPKQWPAKDSDALAQTLVAQQYAVLFRWMLRHLRVLLALSLVMLLSLLASTSCYPFQPRQMLLLFNWTLVAAYIATAVIVVLQINRNELLSRAGDGKDSGNKLTWDTGLIGSLLTYVVLPVASIVAIQFPQISQSAWMVNDLVLHSSK